MKRKIYLAAVVLVSAAAIGSAFAAKSAENDAVAVLNAKIPIAQAIAVAEQQVHGKASKAEYEKKKAGWAYDIEVVSGTKVYEVSVDGEKGIVIASAEDKGDRDDEHDDKD